MISHDANGDLWNVDTLREHLLAIIEAADVRYSQRFEAQSETISAAFVAQENAVNFALAAADKAVAKAEAASEKRFDAINEFRQSWSDQARSLMPRIECEERLKSMKESIDKLESVDKTFTARQGGVKEGWSMVISLISLMGTIAAIIIAIVHH